MIWKMSQRPLDMYLQDLGFTAPLMRWRYYCALLILGNMTASIRPGWRVKFPVSFSITDQYYLAVSTMEDGFLVVTVFFLSFFWSGLRGPKAYSLWGGVVPSPSIGYEYL